MQALFIGQTYIDVTFITDHMPTGDEKHVASAYAVSFGGNAVTAAFCCAKLGIVPDLIATVANDWLGRMFQDMSAKYGISIHPRKVNSSSLSFIMPKDGKRAIVRCRDDEHIHPFPILNLKGCRALHVDGHQPDAAIHYAKLCREAGILTSLDGGGLRTNTHELLEFIDVAIVAERLCEQMDKTPEKMLDYLKSRGCRVGGVTMGEKGLFWYDETGAVRSLPALPISRDRVLDTNGAGDVFHGAYVYSYLAHPGKSWQEHFEFARAASTYKIQRLGNEAGLPTLADIEAVKQEFAVGASNVMQGLTWGGCSSPAASTWMWWRRPTAIRRSARPSPVKTCCISRRQGRQPGGGGREAGRADHADRSAGRRCVRQGVADVPRGARRRPRLRQGHGRCSHRNGDHHGCQC